MRKSPPSVVYWLDNNLYLNITNRCPNNCYFCLRNFRDGVEGFNLKLDREPRTDEIIRELQRVIGSRRWREVVFCGFGEPLERLDCLLEVARWVKGHYGSVVRVDTNGQGYLLNGGRDVVRELREAGVERLSVSLNAHNREVYNYVCRPTFENAFESVLGFVERGAREIDTEVTVVTIPEVDISRVKEMATKMGVRLRLREYIPFLW